MIDDRGRALLERFEGAEHRGPADHLEVQRGVEAPPDLLEDLLEVCRRLRWCWHPSRERRIQMVVAADEAGRGVLHVSRRRAGRS